MPVIQISFHQNKIVFYLIFIENKYFRAWEILKILSAVVWKNTSLESYRNVDKTHLHRFYYFLYFFPFYFIQLTNVLKNVQIFFFLRFIVFLENIFYEIFLLISILHKINVFNQELHQRFLHLHLDVLYLHIYILTLYEIETNVV